MDFNLIIKNIVVYLFKIIKIYDDYKEREILYKKLIQYIYKSKSGLNNISIQFINANCLFIFNIKGHKLIKLQYKLNYDHFNLENIKEIKYDIYSDRYQILNGIHIYVHLYSNDNNILKNDKKNISDNNTLDEIHQLLNW